MHHLDAMKLVNDDITILSRSLQLSVLFNLNKFNTMLFSEWMEKFERCMVCDECDFMSIKRGEGRFLRDGRYL